MTTKLGLEQLMRKLQGKPVLVNRPTQTIAKVGNYEIIVKSGNPLEEYDKFTAFCQEFKGVLLTIVRASEQQKMTQKPDEVDTVETVPTVAHEGVS